MALKYQHIKYQTQSSTTCFPCHKVAELEMEDYNSETDSDYTSYWRDWVGELSNQTLFSFSTSLLSAFPNFSAICGRRLGFLCAIISSHTSSGACQYRKKLAFMRINSGWAAWLSLMLCWEETEGGRSGFVIAGSHENKE